MALQAMWVHGTTVRPEWVNNFAQVNSDRWDGSTGEVSGSEYLGLSRGWGTTYRGRDSRDTGFLGLGAQSIGPFHPETPFEYTQKGYWFHFAIPTPVILNGNRASLQRVFVLWEARSGVQPAAVHVWDGPSRIAALGITRPAADANGTTTTGTNLIDGVSRFNLPSPHSVQFSVGISVAVWFNNDGDITFFSAGADFDA
jgi:hypothetical protein